MHRLVRPIAERVAEAVYEVCLFSRFERVEVSPAAGQTDPRRPWRATSRSASVVPARTTLVGSITRCVHGARDRIDHDAPQVPEIAVGTEDLGANLIPGCGVHRGQYFHTRRRLAR